MKIKAIPTGPIMANCYVVYDEKSLEAAVIDPGSFDEEIQNAIDGLTVKYILLTHGHFDHILGAGELQRATNAQLCIHTDDKICLTESYANLVDDLYAGSVKINLTADRLLNNGDTVSFGDIELKVKHTPGHSKGSVIFICEKEKVIFTGDTLFADGFGRTDLWGGDFETLRRSLRKIMHLEGNYHLLCGHGGDTYLDIQRNYYS